MKDITVKMAKINDVRGVLTLDRSFFKHHYISGFIRLTEDEIKQVRIKNKVAISNRITKQNENEIILVAFKGRRRVGFISGVINRIDENICEVDSLYVSKYFQRKQIGAKLEKEICNWCLRNDVKIVITKPDIENISAKNAYEKYGYKFIRDEGFDSIYKKILTNEKK